MSWFTSHPLALLVSFNMIMMTIQKICDVLKIQEPKWLQTAGNVIGAAASWASANTVTASGSGTVAASTQDGEPPLQKQA